MIVSLTITATAMMMMMRNGDDKGVDDHDGDDHNAGNSNSNSANDNQPLQNKLRVCTWSLRLARQESSQEGVHADPHSQAEAGLRVHSAAPQDPYSVC